MELTKLEDKKREFINTIGYLGTIYNKTFTEKELEVWYDMLKDYPDEVLVKVIKEIGKTEQFMPTIATIISKCKEYKPLDRFEVLEIMRANNYFKTADEYMKAKHWLETGVIPQWFKDEITKTYNTILEDNGHYISTEQNNTTQILLEENIYDD
jgi:hypothetical protein